MKSTGDRIGWVLQNRGDYRIDEIHTDDSTGLHKDGIETGEIRRDLENFPHWKTTAQGCRFYGGCLRLLCYWFFY